MVLATTRDPYVEELLVPAPDGVIVDFQTSVRYEQGHVKLWRNGVLLVASSTNGYLELGGTTIRFQTAPGTGDMLEVRYNPT